MDILQMSFSASVLIVAVVIIRALTLHKLPKKMFLVLWGVVICRLLLPFSIPSRFSFYTGIDMAKRMFAERIAASFPVGMTGVPSVVNMPNPGDAIDLGASAASISPIEFVWLIGMCACAAFFITAYIKCRREFKMSLPVENDFVACWLRENNLRRTVQVQQSDRVKAPLTYGVFRPVVLLPKTTDWMDETRMRYILTHEFVHIRRFDTLTKLALAAAVCVHWFNPLVWVMYILVNRDIELSCDETVVRTFGETIKSAYALTLIGLEENKSRLTPLVNNFSKNAIEERIVSIMKIKKTSLVGIILALALVIGTTIVFATDATNTANVSSSGTPNNDSINSVTTTSTPTITAKPVSNSDWVWPVEGCYHVASLYGKRVHPITGTTEFSDHIAIARNGVEGATVYAALAGTVSKAEFDDEQGNYIVISHDGAIQTIYRHLSKLQVSAGNTVTAGDTIGTVGSTGKVTGACLSFCVYVNGTAVNPLDYLQKKS
jgi:murein DD-endopeptidase MepM/ murein hydrolase activator NlpD